MGLFMVACALPSILFVKQIGKSIESHSSRMILIRSDVLASLLLFSVALLLKFSFFSPYAVFAVGFCAAILQAFIDPTLNKSIPEVVADTDAETAVALITTTQSIANFSGAVLGALLIQSMGVSGTIGFAAFGYLISSSCTSFAQFKTLKSTETPSQESGWEVLQSMPFVKKLLLGFALTNFFGSPVLVILPIYTRKVLMGDAHLLGFLEASVWMGLIAGAFLSKLVHPKISQTSLIAICVAFFGIGLSIPGLIAHPIVYSASLLTIGIALGVNNVKVMAYFQSIVPNELKGRFFSLLQAAISFTFPISYFLFGALTDYISITHVCLIQGFGVLGLSAFFFSLSPSQTLTESEVAV